MSDRDFFREVDEAVRHDRYKELWDKYGLYALVAAALIVAGVAGFKAWTYWQERKSQEAGTEFSQALGALDGGDAAKANNALNDLAAKGPAGYRVILKRISNDKTSLDFNAAQLEGRYFFAQTEADVAPAFQGIQNQILRLSK